MKQARKITVARAFRPDAVTARQFAANNSATPPGSALSELVPSTPRNFATSVKDWPCANFGFASASPIAGTLRT
jgi:hypothetical protein